MKYFLILCDTIDGVLIPFLRNMDEIDHSEWADSRSEAVCVPGDLTVDQIAIPVDRAGKHITLAGCICVNGSFMIS
jgi:hypothetical protein